MQPTTMENRSKYSFLQGSNATTVIVPHVSEHAWTKDFLAFSRDFLLGCPAKGLTRGSSKQLNPAGTLYIDGCGDRLINRIASYDNAWLIRKQARLPPSVLATSSPSSRVIIRKELKVKGQFSFDNVSLQVNTNQGLRRDFIQAQSRRFHL